MTERGEHIDLKPNSERELNAENVWRLCTIFVFFCKTNENSKLHRLDCLILYHSPLDRQTSVHTIESKISSISLSPILSAHNRRHSISWNGTYKKKVCWCLCRRQNKQSDPFMKWQARKRKRKKNLHLIRHRQRCSWADLPRPIFNSATTFFDFIVVFGVAAAARTIIIFARRRIIAVATDLAAGRCSATAAASARRSTRVRWHFTTNFQWEWCRRQFSYGQCRFSIARRAFRWIFIK